MILLSHHNFKKVTTKTRPPKTSLKKGLPFSRVLKIITFAAFKEFIPSQVGKTEGNHLGKAARRQRWSASRLVSSLGWKRWLFVAKRDPEFTKSTGSWWKVPYNIDLLYVMFVWMLTYLLVGSLGFLMTPTKMLLYGKTAVSHVRTVWMIKLTVHSWVVISFWWKVWKHFDNNFGCKY